MRTLTEQELAKIYGGFGMSFWLILGGVITFTIGFFDGYSNPNKCKK